MSDVSFVKDAIIEMSTKAIESLILKNQELEDEIVRLNKNNS